jgi:hypothetical protein
MFDINTIYRLRSPGFVSAYVHNGSLYQCRNNFRFRNLVKLRDVTVIMTCDTLYVRFEVLTAVNVSVVGRLGCDAMWFSRWIATLRRNISRLSSYYFGSHRHDPRRLNPEAHDGHDTRLQIN